MTPPENDTKVHYKNKKDALTKLNFLRRNVNRKKLPVRAYFDGEYWKLTKLDNNDDVTLEELLVAAICYVKAKKYRGKQVAERERRLINKIENLLK